MSNILEYGHAGGFILSEAAGQRSRENVTLLSGQVVKAGTVLGKLTSGGKYVAYDENATPGAGSDAAVAISINNVDATGGDKLIAVIARDAEVNGYELVYKTLSPPQNVDTGATDLAAVNIRVRWGGTAHQ